MLKSSRTSQGKTLREVEGLTGISNGYLSQLESDAIKQPSPRHLEKLAETYQVDYAVLMRAAGYAVAERVGGQSAPKSRQILPGLEQLTEEEKLKIQAYIKDLLDARRAREPKNDSPVGGAKVLTSSRPSQ